MLAKKSRPLPRTSVFIVVLVFALRPHWEIAGTEPTFAAPSARLHEVIAALPVLPSKHRRPDADYFIDSTRYKAAVFQSSDGRELIMDNGLVQRRWRIAPNGACVAYDNLMTGQAMLRSIRPEARLTIDGTAYDVGGLVGQPNHAFLTPTWLAEMQADPQALRLVEVEVGKTIERFAWHRRRHAAPDVSWPPRGVRLRMDYVLPPSNYGEEQRKISDQHIAANDVVDSEGLTATDDTVEETSQFRVSVHYELYDGVPVMCKWLSVRNGTDRVITVDRFTGEELALVEHANWVEHRDGVPLPKPAYLHVETDFAFGGFNHQNANRHVVHWRTDPLYATQVNWARQTPCLLVCEPTYGPAQRIGPNEVFSGFRVFELAYDDGNRERRGLALRRMYRTVAPWTTENPITHHLLTNKADRVREAIDEAAEVGFEAIILSFGSGFNMENRDPAFLATWKGVADYAEHQGIELGSYSLFSSRGVGGEHMIVSPEGQRPTHGKCPAVTSTWGQQWLKTIREFYDATGFDQFENDGPYPGDIDVTSRPPLQQGIEDSRWVQWRMIAGLYRTLRGRGVYINAPDYYYLNGSNKCGMGYREVNWSLPRAQQVIHTRQNIYDGSWTKTPSMGWMFVPLTQYHGGGAAATIEPLGEHLAHYETMMRSNLGMGVQAHYRGPRLFDTQKTREMVQGVVDWYKQYRDILESDIVHGRRADGRQLDWILHVNPMLEIKGMLCVYNPLDQELTETLRPNLYYTGLTDTVRISDGESEGRDVELARDFSVDVEVTVPAKSMRWFTIR